MKRLIEPILVFLLAALAGMLRYLLTQTFPSLTGLSWPLIAINLVGVFLLTYFVKSYLPQRNCSPTLLTGLGVGFLGGLTTLASPLLDMVLSLQAGDFTLFVFLLLIYLPGGLAVAFFAYESAHKKENAGK